MGNDDSIGGSRPSSDAGADESGPVFLLESARKAADPIPSERETLRGLLVSGRKTLRGIAAARPARVEEAPLAAGGSQGAASPTVGGQRFPEAEAIEALDEPRSWSAPTASPEEADAAGSAPTTLAMTHADASDGAFATPFFEHRADFFWNAMPDPTEWPFERGVSPFRATPTKTEIMGPRASTIGPPSSWNVEALASTIPHFVETMAPPPALEPSTPMSIYLLPSARHDTLRPTAVDEGVPTATKRRTHVGWALALVAAVALLTTAAAREGIASRHSAAGANPVALSVLAPPAPVPLCSAPATTSERPIQPIAEKNDPPAKVPPASMKPYAVVRSAPAHVSVARPAPKAVPPRPPPPAAVAAEAASTPEPLSHEGPLATAPVDDRNQAHAQDEGAVPPLRLVRPE